MHGSCPKSNIYPTFDRGFVINLVRYAKHACVLFYFQGNIVLTSVINTLNVSEPMIFSFASHVQSWWMEAYNFLCQWRDCYYNWCHNKQTVEAHSNYGSRKKFHLALNLQATDQYGKCFRNPMSSLAAISLAKADCKLDLTSLRPPSYSLKLISLAACSCPIY
jgi:hypothetical protein